MAAELKSIGDCKKRVTVWSFGQQAAPQNLASQADLGQGMLLKLVSFAGETSFVNWIGSGTQWLKYRLQILLAQRFSQLQRTRVHRVKIFQLSSGRS